MNKIQKTAVVFSIVAASLILPCAAAPASESAAAPAPEPVVAPPPAPVPVPEPALIPAPAVEDEASEESGDSGGPAPAVEAAAAEPAEEPVAAADSALAENEKKVKKEKVKKEKKVKEAKPPKPPKEPKPPEDYGKAVKFGGRLAYNNSYVTALSVAVYEVDMSSGEVKGKTYDNKPGLGGSGFELGGAAEVRLAGPLSLYTGVGLAFRNPVAIEGALAISEMALNVPVLLRVTVVKPVFLDVGGQLDIPFGTKSKLDGGKAVDFEGRTAIDAGAVLGTGGYIMEGLSVDVKGVIGIMKFDEEHEKPVYQVSVGVSYMY